MGPRDFVLQIGGVANRIRARCSDLLVTFDALFHHDDGGTCMDNLGGTHEAMLCLPRPRISTPHPHTHDGMTLTASVDLVPPQRWNWRNICTLFTSPYKVLPHVIWLK